MTVDLWQDREIRFDTNLSNLAPCPGENEIDSINSVEDTKGNNGERGALSATNLRLIWCSHKHPKTNLSIGFNTILHMTIKTAESRLRGNTQALYLLARYENSRFEFIFTSLVRQSPRLFTTVQSIYRSYETTKLYRDLKLRGAIIESKQLILLPGEIISNQYSGIWNLSSEQGNLGVLIITNIRVVWFAELAENFNVSVPYIQIKSIKVKKRTRFGRVLVIDTIPKSGGYVLGFRVDPPELLDVVLKELNNLRKTFSRNPMFGVKHESTTRQLPLAQRRKTRIEEKVNIVEEEEHQNLVSAYLERKVVNRQPSFDTSLGIAIQKLPEGRTMQSIWSLKGGST